MSLDTLDLEAARARFDEATDLTVGLEEEFALLDPGSLLLVDRFEELKALAASDDLLAESVAGELIGSEIEIRSGRGENLADARARQRVVRDRLFDLAGGAGVALASTGTHPLSDYRDQHIIDTPHYRELDRRLRYVAWRNNTWSLHVHVGVRGADRALRVCDRLRPVLPLLLAVSANSPYIDMADSGLHSGRSMIFTRTFPRCGVPDAFGSWDEWARYVSLLVATRSITEFTQIWWSIRPHHAFGTVEVRICDAQTTAQEAEAIAGLVVACVAQAAADEDDGVPMPHAPGRLIEENLWRAMRHGQDGRLIDFGWLGDGSARGPVSSAPVEFEASETVERLLAWTAPARDASGIVVPDFPDMNGAQRQRRMIDAGATPAEVYAACVAETKATYVTRMETRP